jgi:hypothetical protein
MLVGRENGFSNFGEHLGGRAEGHAVDEGASQLFARRLGQIGQKMPQAGVIVKKTLFFLRRKRCCLIS